MGTLQYAERAAQIARWTATPEADRADPARTALAMETLAWWYGILAPEEYTPSVAAKVNYAVAYAQTFVEAGLPKPPAFVPPGNPWVAFTYRGPGKPPPAVLLMKPAEAQPGAVQSALWEAFYNWTGPGWAYQILAENKVPTNGLLTVLETAMGKVTKMGGEAIGAAAGGLSSLAWGVAAVAGLYLLATRRKDRRG